MSKLSGKIVIITGASGAVGKVVTTRFLDEGAQVVALHSGSVTSKKFLAETKKKYTQLMDAAVDVSSENSVIDFFENFRRKQSTVDVLIHLVGGVSEKRLWEEVSPVEWKRMFSLNVVSLFFMTRNVLPMMKQSRFGRIIAISSKAGVIAEAHRGAYGAAKSTVIAMIKTIAEEQRGTGDITANVIAPSVILTEENKQWGSPDDQNGWVTPEEIAETIVHLCGAPSINGQVVHMFGKGKQ